MTAPPPAPLTRDQADQVLTSLREQCDRLATRMFGLDSHSALAFLRGSGLTGTTARIGTETTALMTVLWARFTALRQHLERANGVRESRSRPGAEELAALTELLRTPVVPVDAQGLPLDGAGAAAAHLSLPELARMIEAAATELSGLLDEVDTAVGGVANQLTELSLSVDRLRERAAELSPALVSETDRLARERDELHGRALADPVEVTRAPRSEPARRLHRLGAELEAAAARAAVLERIRDEAPQRLASLQEKLGTVADAQASARTVYDTMLEKIADPGLPPVPDTTEQLRQRLEQVQARSERAEWDAFLDAAAELSQTAAEQHAFADRLGAAAAGLLERRTELRGRLGGYHAKAARHGFGEHPELAARHREAHDVLYTSPCDLPAATRAVFRYQQALAGIIDESEGPKETLR